jgi:hypothetical protein
VMPGFAGRTGFLLPRICACRTDAHVARDDGHMIGARAYETVPVPAVAAALR